MSVATLEPKTISRPKTIVAPVQKKSPSSQFERYDTINTSRIAVIGFVSAILVFGVVVSAQAAFFAADNGEAARKAEVAIPNGLTEQQSRLAGYGWVNAADGTVHIPVESAMKLVVGDQKSAAAK